MLTLKDNALLKDLKSPQPPVKFESAEIKTGHATFTSKRSFLGKGSKKISEKSEQF